MSQHSATILFKRSDSATAPGSGILSRGEPAYTFGTGYDSNDGQRLFVGVPNGGTSRSAIVGGEYYTTKMNHTPGVLQTTLPTGAEQGTVALVDSLGVIDKWRVDTITTSTGNLVLDAATGTIAFSGATLDSIGSLNVDSATINNVTIAAGGNLTVPNLDVTDSAHIEFFSADSAYIDSAKIDQLRVDSSASIQKLTVVDSATFDSVTANYIDVDSADIGAINITGTTIQSTSGSTLTINPYPVGDSGELVILGDLRVEGTTTTVNSTEVTISDKNLVLGDDATITSDLTGGGIQIGDSTAWGSTTPPRFEYYDVDSEFQINRDLHITGSGNISADSADFIKLDVTGLSTFDQVNADSVYIRTFDFDSGHIDSVDIDNLQVDSANISSIHINYADIDSAHIDSVDIDRTHIDFADIDSAHIDSVDIDRAQIDSVQVTNLSATNASFTNISGVDSAHFTILTGDSATFDILRITDSVGLKTLFDSTDFIFINAPGSPQVALKAEAIEDFVGAMVDSTTSIQNSIHVRYDDSGGAIDFTVPLAGTVSSSSATAPQRGDSAAEHPDTSLIANGAGLAKFNDSDFRVTVSTGYVEINQVDGGHYKI
jgi:hypothetical protein